MIENEQAGRTVATTSVNGVPVSPPAWLSGWLPAYRVPVPKTEVRAQIDRWEGTLRPADLKAVTVLLDQTLALWPTPANWQEVSKFYFEALEDVPLDLVQEALKHVRMTSRFFPKPAEIREPIADELTRRKRVVQRLRTALQIGDYDERD